MGSCNGTYLHLIRSGIGQTSATLEVGGRNIKEENPAITFRYNNPYVFIKQRKY